MEGVIGVYAVIRKNYALGRWSKSMVRRAVLKNLISKDEYYMIMGENYR